MRWRGLCAALLLAAACGGEAPPPLDLPVGAIWEAEVESWRAGRMESLRRPDGWLSLVGLYWLDEGASTFGAGPDNDLVFPSGPERLGVLYRDGRDLRLEAAPGAGIHHQGEPVERLTLSTDADGEPTVLELGSLLFYLIERGERIALRLKDRESQLLREFEGIDHFAVDSAWRLVARFEPYDEPRMVPVPDVTGDVREQPCHGAVVFTADGAEHRLSPLGEPDGELFLVFGDETNGEETYGGGRFLYAGPPDAWGRLVVDFNRAYNPPCVFTPYATCPLPPRENRLALGVEAGEKSFGAGH